MNKLMYSFFSIALTAIMFTACSTKQSVDMIVHNGIIYTVDSMFTVAEAFAIKDGKFIEIGSNKDILNKYDAGDVIDARGKAIYPGFYDAHAHFFGLGNVLDEASLFGATSFEEIVEILKAFRQENPDRKWLIGRGWDQNLWPNKAFPNKEQLDKAFPDVPVYLVRVDGHAAIVNSKAFEIAGIVKAQQVEGGLMHEEGGELTGVLIDNAMDLIGNSLPESSEEDWKRMLVKAQDSCLAVGLTTIVDAGLGRKQIDLLKKLYDEGVLKIRDYVMVALSPENLDHYLKEGIYKSDKLTVRSFKIMGDGALGSRGACLLQNYSDANTKGFLLNSPEALDASISRIAASDFQANTHAIGDSANRIVLDTYGKYLKGKNDRRWRVEHAQIIDPSDFYKFSKFSIIPSVQPTHATSDMYWAQDRLGTERMKGAYAYRDLLKEYGMLALGSDFPVEHFNPLYGFHAAVARVDAKGYPEGGFNPENAISRIDALRGMTIWAAFASFEEATHGSIEKGKAADFVILNDDIMKADNDKLRGIKVLRTVIGGESVFLNNISD
jgi:predicted amidohydrolase YtcJ